MQTRPHPLPIGAAALFALTLLLSAPAQASVSEAMGPLVFELLDGGMLCAGVAEVAEADFSYSCALEGPDNGLGGLACVEVLDERCAPDIEAAAGATLLGTADSTLAGSDIAGVGDVNGDGFDDLLIAATNIASGTGDVASAHLVLGPVIGEVSLADSAASFTLDATSTTTEAIAVSGAGDVDGDGYPDLIIGSQEDESAASEAGAAFLLLSSSRPTFRGELTTADADATLLGEARDWAGGAVAGAGDIDGDGYGDLLIGAHRAGINGAAYLISGPVTGALSLGDVETRFVGEHAGSEAGGAVASAGDVDGDGNADLLIGAPAAELGGSKVGSTEAGAVYLILGPVSGEVDLASADAKLSAESTSDEAGESLDGPGDIDGDGYDDLLIGAPLYSGDSAATASQGAAYLVSGPISGDLSLSDPRRRGRRRSGRHRRGRAARAAAVVRELLAH
jgi:hypothetical protein